MLNRIAVAAAIGGLFTFPITANADASSEIATAAQHAGFAAAAANLPQTHMHLHHAVNCLVGPQGAGFDKTNMNPCAQKGNGAIPDESDTAIKAKLQGVVAVAEDGIASTDEAAAKNDATSVETRLKEIK
jgi:hypothetical protein